MTFFHDFRYALRQLRKNPGFACTAILILGLGIGATTAIFSAVNPVLFEPLPYPHANRIVMIWYAGDDGSRIPQTFHTYRELAERLVAVRSGLQVLFLSGYTDAVVRHGLRGHELNFLQKPFTAGELARKVRKVLDGVVPN